MFFTCMVQICSSLSWTNFLSVPYANFSTYMVQISSTLSRNKLSICTICKFFLLYGTDLFFPELEQAFICTIYKFFFLYGTYFFCSELDKLSICTIYEIFRVYGTDFFQFQLENKLKLIICPIINDSLILWSNYHLISIDSNL